jgi:putative ATPase
LRNAPTKLMKGLGYGKGYKYAHDYADAQVEQEHFPPNLQGQRYYEPTNHGFEASIRERLAWRDAQALAAAPPASARPARPAAIAAPSAGDANEFQDMAGEESQDPGEDDGAQIRRPANSAKRPARPAGRSE